MRKNIFNSLMLAGVLLAPMALTSCLNSDEETIVLEEYKTTGRSLQEDYFTIENAEYQQGTFPASTDGSSIGTVTLNNQALSGGMNFITVRTARPYKYFYVGVEGVSGYYVYRPSGYTRDGNYYVYTIPVYYTPNYGEDIDMKISGETEGGDRSDPYQAHVKYVESQSGDLNINLTFTTAKDVDLHLIMPSGREIYYGNRGEKDSEGNQIYGLDHDSNAGCRIDNLNNENIFIPASMVEAGTYHVYVNLYSNCDRSVGPTTWSVAARFRGAYVTNLLNSGRNPMSGSYAAGASAGDKTEVIRFTITESQVTRANGAARFGSFFPIPLSDMDMMKLEEASWK